MKALTEDERIERCVGDLGSNADGSPLLIVVGGLHGNEHAGVDALQRVFARLAADRLALRGRFVGLAGNTAALARGVRYVDLDLNRAWSAERVHELRTTRAVGTSSVEKHEQLELLKVLDELFRDLPAPAHVLDLHSSSASGAPFATLGDTLRNRELALHFPVTKVLGIEEQIDGGLLEYLNNLGHITLGFEAGQHDDPASVNRCEAMIWLALEASGLMAADDVPDRAGHIRTLQGAARGVPSIMEVRYRHAIEPSDEFVMEPGYSHFQPVRRGEVIARDRNGKIRATERGYILLPLYQGQGNDGFFLGREVRPFWLAVSRLLRRTGAASIAHWLPGVRRKDGDPNTVVVNRNVARWRSTGLFHLLGYRKVRENGAVIELTRRME